MHQAEHKSRPDLIIQLKSDSCEHTLSLCGLRAIFPPGHPFLFIWFANWDNFLPCCATHPDTQLNGKLQCAFLDMAGWLAPSQPCGSILRFNIPSNCVLPKSFSICSKWSCYSLPSSAVGYSRSWCYMYLPNRMTPSQSRIILNPSSIYSNPLYLTPPWCPSFYILTFAKVI